MSAADKREELEARLWRYGLPPNAVRVLLTVADEYAEARAEDEGAARFESLLRRRREAYRLVQAAGLRPCGTAAAARRHRRRGEPLDEACKQAEAADRRMYAHRQADRDKGAEVPAARLAAATAEYYGASR